MNSEKINKIWEKRNVHNRLFNKYMADMKKFDMNTLDFQTADSFDHDEPYQCAYLGSVLSLAPSGKIYMFWCTNQTHRDVLQDTAYFEALEKLFSDQDMWIETNDGDIFACKTIDQVEDAEDAEEEILIEA